MRCGAMTLASYRPRAGRYPAGMPLTRLRRANAPSATRHAAYARHVTTHETSLEKAMKSEAAIAAVEALLRSIRDSDIRGEALPLRCGDDTWLRGAFTISELLIFHLIPFHDGARPIGRSAASRRATSRHAYSLSGSYAPARAGRHEFSASSQVAGRGRRNAGPVFTARRRSQFRAGTISRRPIYWR